MIFRGEINDDDSNAATQAVVYAIRRIDTGVDRAELERMLQPPTATARPSGASGAEVT
jgi:hypothetical protein